MGITEAAYLQERLDDQIKWYDEKSIAAQNRYKQLKGIVIILSASIPLFVGFIPELKI
ncbi:DUF4231 domain-containing protein, partial [Acinetobacter baumannii]